MSCGPRGQGGGFSGRNQWREAARPFRHRGRQGASGRQCPAFSPALSRPRPVLPSSGARHRVRCSFHRRRRPGPVVGAMPLRGRALVLRTEPRRSRVSALAGFDPYRGRSVRRFGGVRIRAGGDDAAHNGTRARRPGRADWRDGGGRFVGGVEVVHQSREDGWRGDGAQSSEGGHRFHWERGHRFHGK